MSIRLYSYYRSSASMRVRIALNLKGVAYEYHAVDLIKGRGEQFEASYAKLNPSCEVPTLVHEGFALGQSVAILDYLEQVYPTPALFPKNPRERGVVLQACEIINSGSQAIYNHRVDRKLETMFGATHAQIADWTSQWIHYGLETLETFLRDKAGRFAVGESISAADCFLVPQLVNARRFNLDLAQFPTLMRVDQNCAQLEEVQRAGMQAQPDSPDLSKSERSYQ